MDHHFDNTESGKRTGCAVQSVRTIGAEARAAQPIGAYVVDLPGAFRSSADGPGAVDDGAVREPRVDRNPGKGRVVRASHYSRATGGRAALPRSRMFNRSHRSGRRQHRAKLSGPFTVRLFAFSGSRDLS